MTITGSTKKLVDTIKEAQRKKAWSDGELSRQLGMAQSQWSRFQRGLRPMTLEFLRAVARVFPELKWQISDFVINGEQEVNNVADKRRNR